MDVWGGSCGPARRFPLSIGVAYEAVATIRLAGPLGAGAAGTSGGMTCSTRNGDAGAVIAANTAAAEAGGMLSLPARQTRPGAGCCTPTTRSGEPNRAFAVDHQRRSPGAPACPILSSYVQKPNSSGSFGSMRGGSG